MKPTQILTTVLCAALLAVPAAPANAAPGSAGASTTGKPAVGSCHTYTAKQLAKPTEGRAAVPCTGPHTAQTVAVLRVKGSPAAKDVFTRYGPRCYRAMTKTLGGNEARIVSTAYAVAFFRPSNKQIKQGAHWLRCDLVLDAGNRLGQIASPPVTDPASDAVARCAIGTKNLRPTVCSRKHTYRATGTVRATGSYPGEPGFAKIAFKKCPARVTTPKRFFLYFPPAEQWRSGFHAMACLSRTSA